MKGKEIKENQLNQLRIYFRKKRKEKKRKEKKRKEKKQKEFKGRESRVRNLKAPPFSSIRLQQFVCLIRSQPESQSTSLLFLCIKLICYLIRAIKKQSEQEIHTAAESSSPAPATSTMTSNCDCEFPGLMKSTTRTMGGTFDPEKFCVCEYEDQGPTLVLVNERTLRVCHKHANIISRMSTDGK